MDTPVTHAEFEAFKELMKSENSRLADEDDRQNHRLDILEANMQEMSKISANTERLAVNMGNMLEVQKQQGERLKTLEARDGEKWRKAMAYIGTAILGAVLAIVFAKIGL